MNNKKKIFLGIALFWLVILVGFIAVKEYTLRTGTEVLLKLRPIDPRDLFRGDYVILSYDISQVDLTESGTYQKNDRIYTRLSMDGEIAQPTGASKTKPADGLYIMGKVADFDSHSVRVVYGIESYFVPEGKGLEIEGFRSDMYAKIAIDHNGRGVLKSLVKDGHEITF